MERASGLFIGFGYRREFQLIIDLNIFLDIFVIETKHSIVAEQLSENRVFLTKINTR